MANEPKKIMINDVEYIPASEVKDKATEKKGMKYCNACGNGYNKTPKESHKQWNARIYCSNKCSPR